MLAGWDCSGKAAKIRGLQCELHGFCKGRGFVTLGGLLQKSTWKNFDVGKIKF